MKKEIFESRIDSKVIDQILEASKKGLLYSGEYLQKDNTVCDVCGKSDQKKIILSICRNKEELENDPLGGEVFIFGKTCFRKTFLIVSIKELVGA